ncbi:MAG: transporter [Candidatus Omnitrophota bacterium]|nr:transporter [Candidatus Omnitrophota bacterium]
MQRIFIWIVFTTFIFFNTVFANSDTGQEEWNPPSAGPITTWTAPLCAKGEFVIQPFFFYNRTRGTFNSDSHYDSLPKGDKKYQYQEQLFMQYGLTERLEIDGQLVYQQNFVKRGDLKAHSRGFGDSYLFLRYCALEEQKIPPHITGVFQLKVPTGKYQKADPDKLDTDLMGATSGGGSYDHGYGINLTKKLKPFIIHADAIYSFPLERKVDGAKTRYARYLNYDFGLEYLLPKGFNLMLEFNGFLQGDKKQDGEKVSASDIDYFTIAPGIGWSNEKIQTLLAYQRTLTGTNTDANDSVIVTFVYAF